MGRELRFDDKVVLVTGAGQGLGRSHALMFAARGAKVVVNDLGGGAFGEGKSSAAADAVVAQIREGGGEAVANYDSVEDGDKLVQTALDTFGRIDVVVNNAGILRDTSFAKMTQQDWDLIYKVHLLGAFRVTHAAWPHMREQGFGRIVFTASAAGIYGNFGQANYAMAKLGLHGFAQTLAIEGLKKNVHVNTIAPIAGSRLTETVLPQNLIEALDPEYVSPLVGWLCHESCEDTGGLYEVGGGYFAKLRWERAAGKTFRVGRPITMDAVKQSWKAITSFEQSEHPTDIHSSMAPVLANVTAGPSKGGNQFFDLDEALGYEFPESTSSYDEKDLALYALGVGAGENPLDAKDLALVYEMHGDGFKALPTFGVIPAINVILDQARRGIQAPGMHYGLDRLLHGEQYTEVLRPLPPKATLTHRTRVRDILDKGKNALVVTEQQSLDEDGNVLVKNEFTAVIRGAGGWGGERGTPIVVELPEGEPDAVAEQVVHPHQALIYRLSGDWNPLHADPAMAQAFGFEKPILHGLCTYGYVARHVINAFCGGDPRTFKSIRVRFADSVYPGETLRTEMWKVSDTEVVFQCKAVERDAVVITNARIELYTEIPKAPEKEKAAPATSAEAQPIAADVFHAMGRHVQANPDVAARVGVLYQFALSNPDSTWTLDLKSGSGAVYEGETAKPECTLALSDADFMAMCRGEADPQDLFFKGQLKISGNIMASQKLDFLTKIDPAWVIEAAQARSGGGAPAQEAAGGDSSQVFGAIAAHVAKHRELVGDIGTIYQFRLTGPDSVWTLDLKNGAGSCVAGEAATPDCTLTLSDADFMAMTSGAADPNDLFFSGKLKVTGNIMASQKLTFLQQIDPAEAKATVPQAAPPAAARGSQLPALVEAIQGYVDTHPELASAGTTIQLVCTDPEGTWVLAFTEGGGMREGTAEAPDAIVTVNEEALIDWTSGAVPLASLHQKGLVRIDGDIRTAQHLAFVGGLRG